MSVIITQGKRDPAKDAALKRKQARQAASMKKPKKKIDQLTKAERDAAIDAMLEWWLAQEE